MQILLRDLWHNNKLISQHSTKLKQLLNNHQQNLGIKQQITLDIKINKNNTKNNSIKF